MKHDTDTNIAMLGGTDAEAPPPEAVPTIVGTGVIEGLPFEDYIKIDACSQSQLKRLIDFSPLHSRYAPDPTDAQRRGTNTHALLLEPGRFANEYAILDDDPRRGTKAWQAAEDANPGKIILKAEEGRTLAVMREAVWRHPAASRLLLDRRMAEVTLLWERDGVPCKCRLDLLHSTRTLVDLKSARSAKRQRFARSIGMYGYHIQGAWSLEGATANGLDPSGFGFIVIENEEPHAVACYLLDEPSLEAGRKQASDAFVQWAKCWTNRLWTGYSDVVETISLTEWDMRAAHEPQEAFQ